MIRIQIDDRAVLDARRHLEAAGSDLRPALHDIGGYLIEATRCRFTEDKVPVPHARGDEPIHCGRFVRAHGGGCTDVLSPDCGERELKCFVLRELTLP